jgi:hypothetical protein
MYFRCESGSNAINERDSQFEKLRDPRLSTLRGISLIDVRILKMPLIEFKSIMLVTHMTVFDFF